MLPVPHCPFRVILRGCLLGSSVVAALLGVTTMHAYFAGLNRLFLDPAMAVVYTESTTSIVLRPYQEVVRVIRDELAQRLVVIHIKIDVFQH
jgi:hypothetical protein